jgi:hypothetical protein
MSPNGQMVLNGPQWFSMVSNGPPVVPITAKNYWKTVTVTVTVVAVTVTVVTPNGVSILSSSEYLFVCGD